MDFLFNFLILGVIITPLLGFIIITFVKKTDFKALRIVANLTGIITFIEAIFLLIFYNKLLGLFQYVFIFDWLNFTQFSFTFGFDSFSLIFIVLSAFINCCCFLACWNNYLKGESKLFYQSFLIQEVILHLVFSVMDILLFYIFFESVLITMFVIIGIFGSRERKIRASYMFFIYTLLGSVLMMLSILFIYFYIGTTDYLSLLAVDFNYNLQKLLWLTFFFSFAVKVPMVPFHIWLPEAHVEAPTVGSVILAGILLKLGTYGFLRFSLPLFPYASIYFTPFVYTIAILGLIYASLTAIRQTDIKRVIAYSSIAHMNLIMIGLFSLEFSSIEGAIVQMISHGLVSGGLFLLVGVLYDRYHTRLIKYYGGVVQVMPIFATIFLIFTLANMAFPTTSSFVGEFLIFMGTFNSNIIIGLFATISMLFGAIYSLWLFNRVCYGNVNLHYIHTLKDMYSHELFIFLVLLFTIMLIGIYPIFLTKVLDLFSGNILLLIISNI